MARTGWFEDKTISRVIVKRCLQLREDPVQDQAALHALLHRFYRQAESLDDYDVYRREYILIRKIRLS
jgi:hypothetical protein